MSCKKLIEYFLLFCFFLLPLQSLAEVLYLDIYLNGESINPLVKIIKQGGKMYADSAALSKSRLIIDNDNQMSYELIDLCGISGIECEYDRAKQRLYLLASADKFPLQRLSSPHKAYPPVSQSSGALMNYTVLYNNLNNNLSHINFLQQMRLYDDWGVFENTGNYRHFLSTDDKTLKDGYVRYNTYWQYNDEKALRIFRVGDLQTGGAAWSRRLLIGGIKIASRFNLDPDFVSYPYPEFSGEAVLPSDVELFINNNRLLKTQAKAGPFLIDSQPRVTGLNQATIVTRDYLGRSSIRTLQFYLAADLLRAGLFEYDLNIGFMRERFGVESFAYADDLVATGSLRYGVNNRLSLSAHTEKGPSLENAGVGFDTRIGTLGVFGIAAGYGQNKEDSGWLTSLSYNHQRRGVGFSTRFRYQDEGYQDLGATISSANYRKEFLASVNYALDWKAVIGMNLLSIVDTDGDNTTLLIANYNQLFKSVAVSTSLSLDINDNDNSSLTLNLSIPIGKRKTIRTRHGKTTNEKLESFWSISQARLPGSALAWDLGSTSGGDLAGRASWRGTKTELNGGFYDRPNNKGYWAQVSGSVAYNNGKLLLGNRISDAYVIVSTEQTPNIPVYVENQYVGETDRNGQLLVSGLSAYNPVRISIDTSSLPLDVMVTNDGHRIMAKSGQGVNLDFDLKVVKSALIIVTDESGRFLPVGIPVKLLGSDESTVMGWDGEIYLKGLKLNNVITIGGAEQSCRINIAYPDVTGTIPVLGPYVCQRGP